LFRRHAARSAGGLRRRDPECRGHGIALRDASLQAEGDLDFRGTLGLSKEVPVGFQNIRLQFTLDTDASEEQLATLLRLTERYCVVYQTLAHPPVLAVSRKRLIA
jgi:hypothetical protein